MSDYLYDRSEWPNFQWDHAVLEKLAAAVYREQGRLLGRVEALGFDLRQEAMLQSLTDEVLKTSEIEGEKLDAEQVRSSIARRLGMNIGGLKSADRNVEGIVDVMLDATRFYQQPLTEDRLFKWHAWLFPAGRNSLGPIKVGTWRDDAIGPMQVVSGSIGRERIHFQGPPAERIPGEMRAFLDWFNASSEADLVLKAGLAHLWFETIHPFDDGNGRIGRAITDMALARSDDSSQRFYSISAQIRAERNKYYDILEQAQKGTMDITQWMIWFIGCVGRAIEASQKTIRGAISKARFWEAIKDVPINTRQRDVLNRLLDGFVGKLTTSKWATLEKCSHDTALRDIEALIERGVLTRSPGGGRSTSYELAEKFRGFDGESSKPN